ncbi:hypothetical protein [uncultured Gammaproteobacteria bacterium]|nr:hypothetical protein [uncultured Gammaproteobacteria bacterium]
MNTNYKVGFLYSVMFSTIPSIFMAIFVVFEKDQHHFTLIISVFLFWIFLSITIVSFILIVFGIPVVRLLNKFNFINIYSLIILGLIISYVLLLLFSNGAAQNPIGIKFFFIITGMFGGYGFWHGLKK